ncbi:hypothetical protein [Pseudorhodobacter sp.]|uniref:hypothetical protein n=1 Tax=Pseudorhodobacter sp. TaxID=1934400 RepID=UPI0026482FAB|nr:hypothetical protein [Pseudorhodobacter sp.]MDN5785491.1 hypothetical protein [Pseudorhodobacter sp.]
MQYGLRGDPGLWDELEARFAATPMPDSFAALWHLLEEGYQDAVGQPLIQPDFVHVERFNRGGMSQGAVSPEAWAERLFPLISNRFAAHCHRQSSQHTDRKR